MGKSSTQAATVPSENPEAQAADTDKETPLEALASICSVLVVGLFILTFIGQNYLIPSGSMENTLLVGDHLLVDQITLAPPALWMPLIRYREPRRGDIVVFSKPVYQPGIDATNADGTPKYTPLVKRLIGVPGDHIHLHNGIVFVNGVAQNQPKNELDTPTDEREFLDEFPAIMLTTENDYGAATSWVVDLPNHIENGDLVVPPGKYFMMGDNRHNSLDSRFWGFVPRENIIGRPLFNYWSFEMPDDQYLKKGTGNSLAWMGHVVLHFFDGTRWSRTLHPIR